MAVAAAWTTFVELLLAWLAVAVVVVAAAAAVLLAAAGAWLLSWPAQFQT